MTWNKSWKYVNDRKVTQTQMKKHWKKKNQRLSFVISKFSQINLTFDLNFIQWVTSVSQNNLSVVFENEINMFVSLKKTLINNSNND